MTESADDERVQMATKVDGGLTINIQIKAITANNTKSLIIDLFSPSDAARPARSLDSIDLLPAAIADLASTDSVK